MEQTLTELQSKYAYGIGKRLPSALRQSQASFIAIEPAGKDELALMRATHAEEMNTLRAQFRHVLSRAFNACRCSFKFQRMLAASSPSVDSVRPRAARALRAVVCAAQQSRNDWLRTPLSRKP
jgi:hypothetical protein